MDFPAKPEQQAAAPDGLVDALGVSPKYVGRNAFDYIVELDSEEAVRALRPIWRCWRKSGTRRDRHQPRSRLRFHFPLLRAGVGIDEDPVTGSAHCCLGPFWRSV